MAFNLRTASVLRRQFGVVQMRCFSASAARDAQYGFIGLGQMGTFIWCSRLAGCSELTPTIGYNMAKNLQKKLPTTDVLLIQDINTEATKRFADEVATAGGGAQVKIAASPAEAADGSVSSPSLSFPVYPSFT